MKKYIAILCAALLLLAALAGCSKSREEAEPAESETPVESAEAAEETRLVPDTDLSQFNTSPEDAREVLDQIPEIHVVLGREIKRELRPVECVFRHQKLHVELMHVDAGPADPERVLFILPVM